MWVSVTQFKGGVPKGPIPASYVLGDFSAQTNENGEVVVRLNDPLPEFIEVHSFDLQENGPLIPCNVVVQRGVVLTYVPKDLTSYFKATDKAGEIIFVERRLTLWDKIRQEIP